MSQSFVPAASISRRTFVGGALATAAAIALAGGAQGARADEGAADGAVSGGTFNFYINNPVSIDPYNVQEDQGMQVCKCLFDALTTYDYATQQLVGKAATSWEANDDATEFTFHLVEGATFHNGDPVTAASFAYAWNRLVSPNTNPDNPSAVSYHLSMVDGYDDVLAGTDGAELNIECPDDYTLVVHLNMSYADFPYVVSHLATAPIPESAASDLSAFTRAPVGNGAFQMQGEWMDGQYIQVVRNENYIGAKAYVDGVNFMIISDPDTAFTEFEGGNLDYAQIPSGRISAVSQQYGESADGYTGNPGQQALLGEELSTYYLVCNNTDATLGNIHVRKAISYAINRQAICDVVFEGTRVPADGIVPPGINGYEAGSWEASQYDVDKANEELAAAKEELGTDSISIFLSCNSDGGHEDIMQLVQADLSAIGVTATIETTEWAAYLDMLQNLQYQIGRLGWVADYPILDNFIYPNFYTGVGDNRSGYSNPDVDAAIDAARSTVDDAERLAALQEVNRQIGEDFPVIPLMFYRHNYVVSGRVNNFYLDPMKLSDMAACWLSA